MMKLEEMKQELSTIFKANEIHKKVTGGDSLENVIRTYLPNISTDVIQASALQIKEGVESVYRDMDSMADKEWVRQNLNSSLAAFTESERISYLSNLFKAEVTAYPDILKKIDKGAEDKMKELTTKANPTNNDVDAALELVNQALDYHAGLLMRQSVVAMNRCLEKLNGDIIAKNVNLGKDMALAYAAALYIDQQCGKLEMGNQQNMSARLLGITSATSVENSRLMALYANGRIEASVVKVKLKNMFKKAFTFICSHVIRTAAFAAEMVVQGMTFLWVFPILAEVLYFSPLLIVAGSAAAVYVVGRWVISEEDFVDIFEDILEIVKAAWAGCKGLWNRITGNKESKVKTANDLKKEDEASEEQEEQKEAEDEAKKEEAEDEVAEEEIGDAAAAAVFA